MSMSDIRIYEEMAAIRQVGRLEDRLYKRRTFHEIIEQILEYRQLGKLNSTYVEGLIPYINEKDNKIHTYFHQTVTATGRISSTEPNLQNIPTRFDLGKQIRKQSVF